jgi:hypothetical protein
LLNDAKVGKKKKFKWLIYVRFDLFIDDLIMNGILENPLIAVVFEC